MSVICHVNRTAWVILQKAHFELRHVIKFWHCRKLKGFMMIISIAEVPMAKNRTCPQRAKMAYALRGQIALRSLDLRGHMGSNVDYKIMN